MSVSLHWRTRTRSQITPAAGNTPRTPSQALCHSRPHPPSPQIPSWLLSPPQRRQDTQLLSWETERDDCSRWLPKHTVGLYAVWICLHVSQFVYETNTQQVQFSSTSLLLPWFPLWSLNCFCFSYWTGEVSDLLQMSSCDTVCVTCLTLTRTLIHSSKVVKHTYLQN